MGNDAPLRPRTPPTSPGTPDRSGWYNEDHFRDGAIRRSDEFQAPSIVQDADQSRTSRSHRQNPAPKLPTKLGTEGCGSRARQTDRDRPAAANGRYVVAD